MRKYLISESRCAVPGKGAGADGPGKIGLDRISVRLGVNPSQLVTGNAHNQRPDSAQKVEEM